MKTIKELVAKNKEKLDRMNASDGFDLPVKKGLIFEKSLPHKDDLINITEISLTEGDHRGRHALLVGGVATAGYPNADLYFCDTKANWSEVVGWCMRNNVRVIGMSVATSKTDEREEALKIFSEWGGIVIASSGNWEGRSTAYPASSPYTIAVSATNTEDSNDEDLDVTTESFWFAKRYRYDSFTSLGGTSGTQPVIFFTALRYLVANPTAKIADFRRWLFRNSYIDIDDDVPGRLEENERFFIFPDNMRDKHLKDGELNLKLQLDNQNATLNGEELQLRVAPFYKQYSKEYSALCTELRPIFEAMGGNVTWNDDTKTVNIEFK